LPSFVLYDNPLQTDWELSAKRGNQRDMVFFTRVEREDIDNMQDASSGEEIHVVTTSYKVNQVVPFIIKHTEVDRVRMTGDDVEHFSKRIGTLALLRRAWTANRMGQLKPDARELDELLHYLEHAMPNIRQGN
jgi:TusA-related sulfurtransferase